MRGDAGGRDLEDPQHAVATVGKLHSHGIAGASAQQGPADRGSRRDLMASGVMPAPSDQHELGDLTRIVDRAHRTPKRSATIKHGIDDGRGPHELLETRDPGPIDGDLLQHGQHVVVVGRTPRPACVAQSARKLLAMANCAARLAP